MGALLYKHSIAFSKDDLKLEEHLKEYYDEPEKWFEEAYKRYDGAAWGCWYCAILYAATLVFSLFQVWANKRKQATYERMQ